MAPVTDDEVTERYAGLCGHACIARVIGYATNCKPQEWECHCEDFKIESIENSTKRCLNMECGSKMTRLIHARRREWCARLNSNLNPSVNEFMAALPPTTLSASSNAVIASSSNDSTSGTSKTPTDDIPLLGLFSSFGVSPSSTGASSATASPALSSHDASDPALPSGTIASIVLGSVVGTIILTFAAIYFTLLRKDKSRRPEPPSSEVKKPSTDTFVSTPSSTTMTMQPEQHEITGQASRSEILGDISPAQELQVHDGPYEMYCPDKGSDETYASDTESDDTGIHVSRGDVDISPPYQEKVPINEQLLERAEKRPGKDEGDS